MQTARSICASTSTFSSRWCFCWYSGCLFCWCAVCTRPLPMSLQMKLTASSRDTAIGCITLLCSEDAICALQLPCRAVAASPPAPGREKTALPTASAPPGELKLCGKNPAGNRRYSLRLHRHLRFTWSCAGSRANLCRQSPAPAHSLSPGCSCLPPARQLPGRDRIESQASGHGAPRFQPRLSQSLSNERHKWAVNEKYKVKWTMDKVQNSARAARMQTLCN